MVRVRARLTHALAKATLGWRRPGTYPETKISRNSSGQALTWLGRMPLCSFAIARFPRGRGCSARLGQFCLGLVTAAQISDVRKRPCANGQGWQGLSGPGPSGPAGPALQLGRLHGRCGRPSSSVTCSPHCCRTLTWLILGFSDHIGSTPQGYIECQAYGQEFVSDLTPCRHSQFRSSSEGWEMLFWQWGLATSCSMY